MNISKNTVLVTGGATGIGLALAGQFLKEENTVIICGRREEKLQEAKRLYSRIHIKVCDLEKQTERIIFAEWLIKNFPGLNILVNNAGIQNDFDFTGDINIDDIRQEIEINLISPIHLIILLLPHLMQKANPAIINISSGLAFTPLALVPIYCSTKAAVHSLSLSLRHQLSGTSVKVFEIAPPTVDTELNKVSRDRRANMNRGINPEEFVVEAMAVLRNDVYESAIGTANNLRLKREEMFPFINH
jgi:uncharacterized oxidoreductase